MDNVSRYYFGYKMLDTANKKTQQDRGLKRIKAMRTLFNPVTDLSEYEFRTNRYRLSKSAFLHLCDDLHKNTDLRLSQRMTLEAKVLAALYFYAHGSYQRPTGVAQFISQKTVSRYIDEVTRALTHPNILNKYIKFPTTISARNHISHQFYTKYGIPGVLGCVDGSHFHIVKPPRDQEHLYYCRKHFHSMNVQMVCDSRCRIIGVNPKFGGANHDSFVWENSNINNYMQSLHRNGEMVWLLGDSGYPQRPWLMTPYSDPVPNSPEAKFNYRHVVARVAIENTFGRLKNRWRCLSKDRVLHYTPTKCAKIIQACCVLHNLCIDFNMPESEEIYNESANNVDLAHVAVETTATTDLMRGRAVRDQLARMVT